MMMYNLIAPVYDLLLRRIYASFRKRAFEHLPLQKGASVVDIACGTGQNFPYLNALIGLKGTIVGVDLSGGMLRKARGYINRPGYTHISLVKLDAVGMSHALLKEQAGMTEVDAVVCTYGFTTMKNWEIAFHRSYSLLKPGGVYLILDLHAEKWSVHSWFVEKMTGVDMSRKVWAPLERLSHDYHFEYLDPSKYLFGGRCFVASGIKP